MLPLRVPPGPVHHPLAVVTHKLRWQHNGLGLNLYDPGNPLKLVDYLLGQRHTSLVVGHSNTIPELARILCECDIADMDENEYDRLIVITVDGQQTLADTLNQSDLY